MKKCKKCGNEFKSYVYIDGKHCSLTGRSYCLDCSPFGKKNGYCYNATGKKPESQK